MLRIGKLTGNVYDENTKLSSIGECCAMVRKENLDEELKKNGKWLERLTTVINAEVAPNTIKSPNKGSFLYQSKWQ